MKTGPSGHNGPIGPINCAKIFDCEFSCGGAVKEIKIKGKTVRILKCTDNCSDDSIIYDCCYLCNKKCVRTSLRNDIVTKLKIISFLAKLK